MDLAKQVINSCRYEFYWSVEVDFFSVYIVIFKILTKLLNRKISTEYIDSISSTSKKNYTTAVYNVQQFWKFLFTFFFKHIQGSKNKFTYFCQCSNICALKFFELMNITNQKFKQDMLLSGYSRRFSNAPEIEFISAAFSLLAYHFNNIA